MEKMMMREIALRCAWSVGLLAAGLAAATEPPPTSCTTDEFGTGAFSIEVTEGPCAVDCGADDATEPFCAPGGSCTGIEYTVTTNCHRGEEHVVVLVRDVEVVFSLGTVFPPCHGDSVTGAGKFACHEQAVVLSAGTSESHRYRLVVDGSKEAVATSVIVKAGTFKESCRIAGLGAEAAVPDTCVPSCGDFHPEQALTTTEEVTFKDCTVKFTYSAETGEVLSAVLTDDSVENGCTLDEQPVENLEITLNGVSLGMGTFGDGFISSGSNTCTSRVIAGRVYTWGSPCP
jgi:hypothetical protein